MALDFDAIRKTRLAPGTKAAAPAKGSEPKAQLWLNVGFSTSAETTEGDVHKFISLSRGIPLDTLELLPTNSSNEVYAGVQAARNDLLEQLLAHAETLKPGEECIVPLEVQIRRVNDDRTEDAPTAFIRKLDFGTKS